MMRLPTLILTSFLFTGCSATTEVVSSYAYSNRENIYDKRERNLEIWLNYHADCIVEIKRSQNMNQLISAEEEAHDTRRALAQELKYSGLSPVKVDEYMVKIEVSRGDAIIAAFSRENELRIILCRKIDGICARADAAALNAFSESNLRPTISSSIMEIEQCLNELDSVEQDCHMLDMDCEYEAGFEKLKSVTSLLVQSMNSKILSVDYFFFMTVDFRLLF